MTAIDHVQGSPEWLAARCGLVTASRVADIIRRTKSGFSTSRANYCAQLVAERLTGTVGDSYTNAAMQWGTQTEPEARAVYALLTGADVTETGFVIHPRIVMSGASPDGLVGSDGLVEIKCPSTATHIATLRTGSIDTDYVTQMQWQMACTGRAWCDFVSFDPRMPADMQIYIERVPRHDSTIAELETSVVAFLAEVDATLADLLAKYRKVAA